MYTAHIMKLRWWTFLPNLVPSVLGTLVVGLAAFGLTLVQMPTNWAQLAGLATIISLLYAAGVWGVGLSQADRQLLTDLLPWQKK
jgi:hypothetical protein